MIDGSSPSAFKSKKYVILKKFFYLYFFHYLSSSWAFTFVFYSSVLKFFLIVIACLGILTSSFPFFFIIFDYRAYARCYIYVLDHIIYTTIFLEDIIYLCFFCVFLYGLHKNRSFLKREYQELLIILNVYILPYLIKKFKIVSIFIYRYIFLPVKQGFNLYKNRFVDQIKQSQWFNDLTNFYNFLLRKYLPRIKSWFIFKKWNKFFSLVIFYFLII